MDGKTPPPSPKADAKAQKPVEADTPPASADADAKAARQAEIDRKAKLRAKMEEAEKRDQIRRARLAAKANGGATAAGTGGEEASKVENAPRPEAEEGVDEEMLQGSSPAEGVVADAQPEVEAGSGGGAEVRETMVHEEL